ncbi:hypothetical protein K504DRAFT_29194 [Pleomassaria siparia CBS 279.74]|uniref:Uncharacterized protein n=1 Tax=Pleomassaria siparia CBS 279.74 TaxID=1314801 RepID=A0A6G1KSG4_9PLEO|nr:hypothetical protein K504DRAFT_29194 [Pleomassaria siparia CBS 279.74]
MYLFFLSSFLFFFFSLPLRCLTHSRTRQQTMIVMIIIIIITITITHVFPRCCWTGWKHRGMDVGWMDGWIDVSMYVCMYTYVIYPLALRAPSSKLQAPATARHVISYAYKPSIHLSIYPSIYPSIHPTNIHKKREEEKKVNEV